jgi:hypothetical protein
MNDDLFKAIRKLQPTAEFSFQNNDYSTIDWHILEGEAPTQAEIDEAIKQVKADEANQIEANATAKAALLERLGITEDEVRLLLG